MNTWTQLVDTNFFNFPEIFSSIGDAYATADSGVVPFSLTLPINTHGDVLAQGDILLADVGSWDIRITLTILQWSPGGGFNYVGLGNNNSIETNPNACGFQGPAGNEVVTFEQFGSIVSGPPSTTITIAANTFHAGTKNAANLLAQTEFNREAAAWIADNCP
jgi:hypothetical protein